MCIGIDGFKMIERRQSAKAKQLLDIYFKLKSELTPDSSLKQVNNWIAALNEYQTFVYEYGCIVVPEMTVE